MDESQMHNIKRKKSDVKAAFCMILFIWHSKKVKFIGTEGRSVAVMSWWWRQGMTTAK